MTISLEELWIDFRRNFADWLQNESNITVLPFDRGLADMPFIRIFRINANVSIEPKFVFNIYIDGKNISKKDNKSNDIKPNYLTNDFQIIIESDLEKTEINKKIMNILDNKTFDFDRPCQILHKKEENIISLKVRLQKLQSESEIKSFDYNGSIPGAGEWPKTRPFDKYELHYIDKIGLWTDECDKILEKLCEELGPNALNEVTEKVKRVMDIEKLNELKRFCDIGQKHGTTHVFHNVIRYYAGDRAIKKGWDKLRENKYVECIICNNKFTEFSVDPRLAKKNNMHNDICNNCLTKAFWSPHKKKSKGEMKQLLSKLLTFTDKKPTTAFSHRINFFDIPSTWGIEKRSELIRLLMETPFYHDYKRVFGSWGAALDFANIPHKGIGKINKKSKFSLSRKCKTLKTLEDNTSIIQVGMKKPIFIARIDSDKQVLWSIDVGKVYKTKIGKETIYVYAFVDSDVEVDDSRTTISMVDFNGNLNNVLKFDNMIRFWEIFEDDRLVTWCDDFSLCLFDSNGLLLSIWRDTSEDYRSRYDVKFNSKGQWVTIKYNEGNQFRKTIELNVKTQAISVH